MSGDEVLVLIASLALGPVAWAVWFYRIAAVDHLGGGKPPIWVLAGVFGLCGLILGLVLTTLAAPDVRDAPPYLAFYFMFGLAWIRICEWLFAYAGISVRDDVIERRNGAAMPVACGAMLGVTCCFAGGNVGAGPGWWVVAFSGALATIGLAVVWLAVEWAGGVTDLVTIDRDPAVGWRLGGLLAASGLILGRAVAGDWHEAGQTIVDFVAVGWGVAPLAIGAIVVDRLFKPTPEQPRQPLVIGGMFPALIYVVAAAVYLIATGWPA
jgi:hypothetical protein